MRHSKNKEYNELLKKLLLKNKNQEADWNKTCFDSYREMVELFYQRHKRYPIAQEFTHDNLLPSARSLQRNHGGVKKFRQDIGLEIIDYTKGEPRIEKIKKILRQAKQYEQELFVKLFKKHHNPDRGVVVQREPVISNYDPDNDIYGYRRSDVGINTFTKEGCSVLLIDFFFATTAHSFYGCVNEKRKKIQGLVDLDKIFFVSVNPVMTKQVISGMTLPPNCPQVLSYQEFEEKFL